MARPGNTAMVMAAGRGTRMMPLTAERPKPLVQVCGKALIDYALGGLRAGGVERVIANVHYFADLLEAHLRDYARHTPTQEILISDERAELLETGGGLKKAQPLIGEEPFFCLNTDAIFQGRTGASFIDPLRKTWQPPMLALLLLVPLENTLGFDGVGDFHLKADGKLVKARGEPAPYAFTGAQILDPALLDGTPEGPFSTRLIWEKAARLGGLYGCVFDGHWLHVGTPESRDAAEALLRGNGGVCG